MTVILKKKALHILALTVTLLTIFTVNSACFLGLGQEEEPESLNRFKN